MPIRRELSVGRVTVYKGKDAGKEKAGEAA
jgi:hypothetical protein